MTNILFVHNNFPAQFAHLARTLARRTDVRLAAIASTSARGIPGVKMQKYTVSDPDVAATHPFARRFDLECRRAEQVLYAASAILASGFTPDIVIGHPGWGETLPLRGMFRNARHITYCEFYYRAEGEDLGFDPEFPLSGIDGHVAVHLKNASTLLALDDCDSAIAPTQWQRSTYPVEYQPKIAVLHEGVDTDAAAPDKAAEFQLPSGKLLTKADEVLTFVSRSFEPLRGFHILLRALPQILKARPKAQILIIGGTGSPYGLGPPKGQSWREIFLHEVSDQIDHSRVHFTGRISHSDFLCALQISRVHVYLTYPFVLSWSLLEAMSAGCVVIASDTPPVREVVDSENGILVPFFDVDAVARYAIDALARPRRFMHLRKQARATILERYDMKRLCVPKLLDFLDLAHENETREQEVVPVEEEPAE